ncbi:hypothetical protein ACFLRB_06735 [Acidobacteriota bacterium]
MMKKQIIVIIVFVLWFSPWIYSHGLTIKVEKIPPFVMITSTYHGGSVITDAEVTVFLTDPQKEFQKGRVDKKGKFSFIPDREGTWFFRADDGMGHRKTVKIAIGTDFFTGKSKDNASVSESGLKEKIRPKTADTSQNAVDLSQISSKEDTRLDTAETGKPDNGKGRSEGTGDICAYCKILLGVVLIFAITFILYAWKRKEKN